VNLKKSVVITGGAGFIGSGCVRFLNDLGFDNIVIVDDLKQGEKWKNLVGKRFQEIVSRYKFFDWLEGKQELISAFIHLGACSSTVETDADYILETNYRFSQKLALYALKYNHRFIYASSAATYGSGEEGFSDRGVLHQLKPLNMYGFSKHLFDLWLEREGFLDRVVGLKYFNVFGPNEAHKGRMASAVVHVLPQAIQEGVIRLFASSQKCYPDGGQMRDFIYVKDVCRMTCAFLENQAGGIFNIGRGEPVTWNSLAEAIFKALKKPTNICYIQPPEDLKGKYQNYTCADMEKTKGVLGSQASCLSIDQAVEEYVNQYLSHEKRW
jgi:ADP-L-glycero-D-manno-heptose 6-epimerase